MKQRIITALIMIVILATILFALPVLFTPLIGVILGISTWEWCRISKICGHKSLLVASATVLLWAAAVFSPDIMNVLLGITIIHYCYCIRFIYNFENTQNYSINRTYLQLCGPVILATLAASLLYIFNVSTDESSSEDTLSLAYIVMVVAAADSGAYFIGRSFGRHKLSPNVSPNKTLEGLAGGLVSVAGVVLIFGDMVDGWLLSFPELLIISLVTAVFSAIGDLFISIIKRQNDIKDSSKILPGHGGFLDRIDGLMAGIPVFYLLQQLV